MAAIAEELVALDADIVALQEAPTAATNHQSLVAFFREQTAYPHVLHLEYPEVPDVGVSAEGLAFLSKFSFDNVWVNWNDGRFTANNWAVKAAVDWHGVSLGITNVHLDWEQAAGREHQIVQIVRELSDQHPCSHDILCGDFNDDDSSPVAQFLDGRASLDGWSTCWRDLAREAFASLGEPAPVTLDFRSNPRWAGVATDQVPARFDRIYLHGQTSDRQLLVLRSGLFGKIPTNRAGLVPSDHYGVFVDLAES